jgi:hypothetical protein
MVPTKEFLVGKKQNCVILGKNQRLYFGNNMKI